MSEPSQQQVAPKQHSLQGRIFSRIPESDVLNLLGNNHRTELLTHRVSEYEWNQKHMVVMAITQFWYYRRGIRTMPEGTTPAAKAGKFLAFLLLNSLVGTFYTNIISMTPLQAAQEKNLHNEVFLERARKQYGDPQMYNVIKELNANRFTNKVSEIEQRLQQRQREMLAQPKKEE